MDTVVSYLLFIGSSLYLVSALMFLYIFIKILKVKNGSGLLFLRIISLGNFAGSLTIFVIRILSEYGKIDYLTARAIAVVNPIILVGVALYLNYLFHQKVKVHKSLDVDTKDIVEIKESVAGVKQDVKKVKKVVEIVKDEIIK